MMIARHGKADLIHGNDHTQLPAGGTVARYHFAWPARHHADVVEARPPRYAIFVSAVVIDEAGRGESTEAKKRREFLEPFPVLDATPEVQALIKLYIEKGVVPPGNAEDAAHLAFASIYKMEYLCTWNFRHLANVLALRRLRQLNEKRGLFVPQVCTPEELLGE